MSEFINDTKNFGLAAAATREDMSAQSDKTVEKVWVEQSFSISSRIDRIAVHKHFGETSSGDAGEFAIFGKDIKAISARSPETQSATDRLATWSLDPDLKQESAAYKIHPDEASAGREPKLTRIDVQDFEDNGKYHIALQSIWRYNGKKAWTTGTGWLIRDDLVVTAGHNVYSDIYGGQALRIKCWIGYRGRDLSNSPSVQRRNAINVLTTEAWRSQSADRKRLDVAMIQVDAPFTGNLRLYKYISTPSPHKSGSIVIVGYSGDEDPAKIEKDIGGWMYEGRCPVRYDLAKSGHMIEYQVDTYGGQSGAPILFSNDERMMVIGTHCYGGYSSGVNSGNPIGGQYGNNYDEFVKRFKPSTPKTIPLGNFTPKIDSLKSNSAYYDGGSPTGDKQTGFWDIIKNIVKVGSVTLPVVGTLGGPIGTLFGTVAGGIIGGFAKSVVIEKQKVSFKSPGLATLDACLKRAQLAEAALQAVLHLRPSRERDSLWTDMNKTWSQHHMRNITNSDFRALVTPIIHDFGFRLASDQWQKQRVNPNPATKHSKAGNNSDDDSKLTKTEPHDPKKAGFIGAFFDGRTRRVDGHEYESAESLATWLSALFKGAVNSAQPIASDATRTAIGHVIDMIGGGPNAESTPEDAQDADMDMILQRAAMADCALQTLESMTMQDLEALSLMPVNGAGEEGFMDGMKVAIQQGGPYLIDLAKRVMAKHLPGIIEHIQKGKSKPRDIYEESDADEYIDENPDVPIEEVKTPVTPNPDAPPVEPFPPV